MGIPAHELYADNDSPFFLQRLASPSHTSKCNGELAKIKPAWFPLFFRFFWQGLTSFCGCKMRMSSYICKKNVMLLSLCCFVQNRVWHEARLTQLAINTASTSDGIPMSAQRLKRDPYIVFLSFLENRFSNTNSAAVWNQNIQVK